eukprot:TRINITY_DN36281_c0_g1_i1.p1 TRINITY_DN36281_c0_g1~~TRINITY_DN36281_c0_g1_i1.p1  ORF type:complete len:885 (-),score=76.01 TRINITY_DN36281_c0_g1_i1:507-2798(-)
MANIQLQGNRLSGQMPDIKGMRKLRLLSVANNRLSGPFPDMQGLHKLERLLVHNNRFTGDFPYIGDLQRLSYIFAHGNDFKGNLPLLPPVANTVLLHGNTFTGRLDRMGSSLDHLRLVLALPGNYLIGPVESSSIIEHEPLLHNSSDASSLIIEYGTVAQALKVCVSVIGCVVCAFVLYTMSWRPPPSVETAQSTYVCVILRRCQHMLAFQCVAALACFHIYRACPDSISGGWVLLRCTAAYARGPHMPLAYGVILLFNGLSLIWICTSPYAPGPAQSCNTWTKRPLGWSLVGCVILICSFPSLLNCILGCHPKPPDGLLQIQPYLPQMAALLSAALQPKLIRATASITDIHFQRLSVLQGLATWVLPCAILVALSQDCYGLWWYLLKECNDKRGLICKPRNTSFGTDLLYCTPQATFDVITGRTVFNGTHFMPEVVCMKEDICGQRWVKPGRCTTRLLEVVGLFIFMKLLTAAVLPPVFLGACMLGQSDRRWCRVPFPLGVTKRMELDVEHIDVVLWLPFRRKPKFKLACVSEKFSPVHVMQRLATWVDLSLGWGLLHPPTALAGLLYITVELWAVRKAATLDLQFHSADRTAQFPRLMMAFWLATTSAFAALHFASTQSSEPGLSLMLTTLVPMVVTWIICFCIVQQQWTREAEVVRTPPRHRRRGSAGTRRSIEPSQSSSEQSFLSAAFTRSFDSGRQATVELADLSDASFQTPVTRSSCDPASACDRQIGRRTPPSSRLLDAIWDWRGSCSVQRRWRQG